MASNIELNAGSGGSTLVTRQISHDGDTSQLQGVFVMGITGTEDSYTAGAIPGDATNGLLVNLGSNNDVTVTGTVDLGATDNAVLDAIAASVAGTLTVSGTVTSNLSATDNAVLDAIAASVAGTLTVDGSGSTQPVSGTVTANLGATDNAVLDAIAASVAGTLTVDGSASTQPVSGTVTANLSATDNAVLDAIAASAAIIDNPVFADDAAFTLTSSSVMVGGAIRDDSLSTLSAVEGDAVPLRVSSTGALHVTGAGGGTQYNVDDAAGGTDTGTVGLAIRDDSLTTLTAVDGDYVPLRVNSTGALHVTGAGGGTQYAVSDVAGSTDTVTMAGVVRDDALSTLTEADGDVSRLRVNSQGALWVEAVGAATDDAGFTAGTSEGSPIMGAFTTDTVDSGDFGVLAMTAARRLLVDNENVFADDAAFTLTSSKVGVAGAIRDDSLSTLTAVEGDAVPLRVSSTGALHVTGGGGGTEYTEDVATANPIVGNAVMMERDDALSTLTPIEGDWVSLRSSAEGALWVQDFNSDAILSALGGTLTVDLGANNDVTVTGTVDLGATDNAVLDAIAASVSTVAGAVSTEMQVDVVAALPAGDNNIGNVDIVSLPASTNTIEVVGDAAENAAASGNPLLTGGRYDATPRTLNDGDAGAFALDADGALHISDGGNTITVDGTVNAAQSGTWNVTNVSGTVSLPTGASTAANQSTAITALQLIDNSILAHDSAVGSTQTNMAGARATNSIETLTQVAANDGTRITADLNGCLVVRPHTTLEEQVSFQGSNTDGAEDAITGLGAGGAGIHNYLTDVTIYNADSTAGYVNILDGSGGAVMWTFPCPATGGVTHSFSMPLKQPTANTALYFDPDAAHTTIYFSCQGFQAQG